MRILVLFITIFFSTALFGQFANESDSNYTKQIALQFDKKYYCRQLKPINADINFQEMVLVSYKRKHAILFLSAENILNEIFKPDPAIDESGFHYKANPLMEIEETKGNTGFIKFGIRINLPFN